MKFNEKTKNKLSSMMWQKVCDLQPVGRKASREIVASVIYARQRHQKRHPDQHDPMLSGWKRSFRFFLDELRIEIVAEPGKDRKNIYLKDPFFTGDFLKISRDIAEKMLILGGIP